MRSSAVDLAQDKGRGVLFWILLNFINKGMSDARLIKAACALPSCSWSVCLRVVGLFSCFFEHLELPYCNQITASIQRYLCMRCCMLSIVAD